jgi:hypothetical protein
LKNRQNVKEELTSWNSDNFRKRVIKLIPKRIKRRLRMITLQEAINKSPILLSQYWKNE